MTLYARSDINEVVVSPAAGGCGQTHTRPFISDVNLVDEYGRPARVLSKTFAISCGACERFLETEKSLYARSESEVPLTPDEQRLADREAQTGNVLMKQMASAMAESAAHAVREFGGAPGLAAQFRG